MEITNWRHPSSRRWSARQVPFFRTLRQDGTAAGYLQGNHLRYLTTCPAEVCALSGSDGSQMREAGRHQASVGVKIDHGPAALWEEFPPFGCKPSRGRREMSLVG